MSYQMVFKRYELKYLMTQQQKLRLLDSMAPHMEPDPYGKSTIRNIYYDTPDFRLIRASLEKQVYKEKLRVRSYKQAQAQDEVFVELKKKYQTVVYKRRVTATEQDAALYLQAGELLPFHSQITAELDYFRAYYGNLVPKVFLAYGREAFYSTDIEDCRITFDQNILWRSTDLSLRSPVYGSAILPQGQVLMEVKIAGGMPLWLARFLSREKIFSTSFSKYGKAYQTLQTNQNKGEPIYA